MKLQFFLTAMTGMVLRNIQRVKGVTQNFHDIAIKKSINMALGSSKMYWSHQKLATFKGSSCLHSPFSKFVIHSP